MGQIIPMSRADIRKKPIVEVFTKEVATQLGYASNGVHTHLMKVFDAWHRYDPERDPYYFPAPIRTFGDLIDLTLKELMRKPGLGKKTKEYVRAVMARNGIEP